MADTLIELHGKVTGDKEIARLMAYAPEVYRGQLIFQLKKERDSFIGKRGQARTGAFKKKLMRKKIWGGRLGRYGGDRWSPQFTSLFRGKVNVPYKKIENLSLGMGHFFRSQKPIHKAIELLGRGGTITSSGEMIIPIYKNLKSVGATQPKTGMSGQAMRAYGRRGTDNFLIRVPAGGITLYYDAALLAQGSPTRALMFMGVHKITIKKQFDFIGDWKKRESKVINRLQKAIDWATKKINRMK